jgi:hypothetical protein
MITKSSLALQADQEMSMFPMPISNRADRFVLPYQWQLAQYVISRALRTLTIEPLTKLG